MKLPVRLRKPSRATVRTMAMDQLYYLVGCVCYAAAVNLFALPNQIAQSGVSGVAIIVHYLLNTPIGVTNLVLNIPLVVLAWVFLGWRFVSKTLWVTVELSLFLDLEALLLPASFLHTEDRLLVALFCGTLAGFGLAMIMARGASSGGTDIIGWLVRRRWPHISLGRVILAADAAVVIGAAVVFRDLNSAMYACIVMFISTRLIDAILYGMGNGKMFYIFCEQPQQLAAVIIAQLGRGVTVLPAKGAFTGREKEILLCVVRKGEATRLRRLVKSHDPRSFLIIAEAQEILGYGFQDLGS
ncbi:MAG: YitT family protein [Oscillospiraceae bacterium]|nr:YitT family protein [Oscillospiraceae bacterium]